MRDKTLVIGAVMYPGFEMLDMFGPLEMFSLVTCCPVQIVMIAQDDKPVSTAMGQSPGGGPAVTPDATFVTAPAADILLVPGGFGTLAELENSVLLGYLRQAASEARLVCTVCTGSVLLAKAGALKGRSATSNKQFFALTQMAEADVDWVESARWVEDGKYFTSSGVSAGMDMSLAVINRLFGAEEAEAVASVAEYTWHRDAASDPFTADLNKAARQMGLV